MKALRWAVLLALWALMTGWVLAQEGDTVPEEEAPVVPYFQTYTFNVPVLTDWRNESGDNVALFVNEALSASIRVEDTGTSVLREGIERVLQARFGEALPAEAAFENTVNLGDGAWMQLIYALEDGQTVSALGNARNNRTYVMTFAESMADADTYMLIVQNDTLAEEDGEVSPEAGVIEAIETLITDDFDHEAFTVEAITVPGSTWEWTRYQYESDSVGTITALGYVFGRATYTAISTKEDVDALTLAHGFATAHLGFFTTPDNSVYLLLGLVVTLATFGILLLSMAWRWRGIRQDMALLEQLSEAK